MPIAAKTRSLFPRPPRRGRLALPVAGMESEFNVVLDGAEIDPRKYWGHPLAFIEDGPTLKRERSSYQVQTGGAVYFDRGVIEVVTPVIELGPGCAARMVRNLWEQIGFVRDQLTRWEQRTGHPVHGRDRPGQAHPAEGLAHQGRPVHPEPVHHRHRRAGLDQPARPEDVAAGDGAPHCLLLPALDPPLRRPVQLPADVRGPRRP